MRGRSALGRDPPSSLPRPAAQSATATPVFMLMMFMMLVEQVIHAFERNPQRIKHVVFNNFWNRPLDVFWIPRAVLESAVSV